MPTRSLLQSASLLSPPDSATTQTLTNKVIDASKNTLSNVPRVAIPTQVAYTDVAQTFSKGQTVVADAATTVPQTVKAAASQSANLSAWVDSSGNPLASVGPAGAFNAPDVQVASRSLGWGIPAGGTSKLTASTTINATTTMTDTGLAVTATLVNGRRYKLFFDGMVVSSVAADRATVQITDTVAGALKTAQTSALATANSGQSSPMVRTIDCPADVAAGSRTFKIQVNRLSGTGAINIIAAAGSPAQFWIEDVGTAS